MLWVVLCVTFGFIGSIMGLYWWTDWKDSLARLEALKAEKTALDNRLAEAQQRVDAILPYTGFKKGAETSDPPTADAVKYLTDRQKELMDPYLQLKKVDSRVALDTLEDCLEVAEKDLELALKDRDRAAAELERRRSLVTRVEPREKLTQDLSSRKTAELDQKIQQSGEELNRINADFETVRQQEEELAKKATDAAEETKGKHKQAMIRLENEINELKRRLEEVKRREVITFDIREVHGEVVHHDPLGKFATINIGSDQRVVKGLRFYVGVPSSGGRKRYKGEVEVKRVWPTRSEVSIVALYDNEHPVVDGDQLVNPLFDTRRPKIVAFAGEASSRLAKYPVNEATRRILEINTVVRPETTVDLDFLIVTEAYEGDKNYLRAVELQIPVAPASEILKFLGD
jgi:hypothetical protein